MFACGRRRMPTVAAMLPLCILLALPSRASGQADPGTMVHPEPGSRIDSLLFHAFVLPDSLHPNQGLVSLAVYQCGDTTQRALWEIKRPSQRVDGAFDRMPTPPLHPVRQVAGAHVGPAPRCPPSAAWLLLRSYRRWRNRGL